jgi:hypothetical protein
VDEQKSTIWEGLNLIHGKSQQAVLAKHPPEFPDATNNHLAKRSLYQ